jgi:hypothetical protein
MGWLGFERRWCDALFGAMIPAAGGRPGVTDLDLAAFWRLYEECAPPLARLGFRAAVWILTLMPIVAGRLRPFTALDAAQRDAFLVAAAASPFYLVRQLVMTVKTFAAFAYFHDAAVRARIGAADA